jgi:hypothetical protein
MKPEDKDLFDYIVSHKRKYDGLAPTMRDICANVGISSTSQAKTMLKRLVDVGKIKLIPGKACGITVVGGRWSMGSEERPEYQPMVGASFVDKAGRKSPLWCPVTNKDKLMAISKETTTSIASMEKNASASAAVVDGEVGKVWISAYRKTPISSGWTHLELQDGTEQLRNMHTAIGQLLAALDEIGED